MPWCDDGAAVALSRNIINNLETPKYYNLIMFGRISYGLVQSDVCSESPVTRHARNVLKRIVHLRNVGLEMKGT